MGHTRDFHAHGDEVMTNPKRAVINKQTDGYCIVRAFFMPLYVNHHVPDDEQYEFDELLDTALKEILQFPSMYDLDATAAGELSEHHDNGDNACDAADAVLPALVRVTATRYKMHIFDRDRSYRVKTLEPNCPPDNCI